MADLFAAAQHYIECDSCEENPAKFICKTCPGYLCQKCKSEHEDRKITQNHEVLEFTASNKDLINQLFCSEHKTKKIECFCGPCKKPVCTECIVWAHNGHAIQTLSIAYNEIKDELQRKRDEIEKDLCTYTNLLQKEVQKELNLTKQAEEIKKQIEKHTEHVVQMVREASKRAVDDLRVREQTGLKEINTTVADMRKSIQILTERKDKLSDKIQGRLKITFFEPENNESLEKQKEEMATLPPPSPRQPSAQLLPSPLPLSGQQQKQFQPPPSPPPPLMSSPQTMPMVQKPQQPLPQAQPQGFPQPWHSPMISRSQSPTSMSRQQSQQPYPQPVRYSQPPIMSSSQSPTMMSRNQPHQPPQQPPTQPLGNLYPWQPLMKSSSQSEQPSSQQPLSRKEHPTPQHRKQLKPSDFGLPDYHNYPWYN